MAIKQLIQWVSDIYDAITGVITDGKVKTTATTSAATTSTPSNVASSATAVTLLAANMSRFGATIYNDSTQYLYVQLGAAASLTNFAVKLWAGDYYEVPYRYVGIITGTWASANGYARVNELT